MLQGQSLFFPDFHVEYPVKCNTIIDVSGKYEDTSP